ncbi:MAG: YbjN domain-containing protein [Ruminococcus sp.]|nr:YbjN domain-containing protein [Ruminococcus sp.]
MDNNNAQAQSVYESICSLCDDLEFVYERHDDELYITLTITGDDIPMRMGLFVRADRDLVRLLSPMPFKVSEDRRAELALAVAYANYGIIDGSFDYDIVDGAITFRMTASYIESILSKELFKYMLFVSSQTIDRYNDKFLMLSKGMITLEKFIESEKE